ncbi:hypothetical protein KVR01_013600 [Diaporthe batatas]|uniref:uncharacterized protein n=1 Tax=Diaporthe batatas TaxID=748121 RepID=UPI001D04A640|nr:uncharacterized protein KVR01_013600 [Diaporthe batatas]KAG8156496.1 hypothetical protein KVR01_013600 [Diaporthe batatas]
MTRVFTASEGALGNSTDGYEQDIPVTLFGICSNLANATESATRNSDERTASFFPRTVAQLSNDGDLLAANLTTCLATTCEMTRRPSECFDYCGPENLLKSPTEFDFSAGLFTCAQKLCSNTCGLPFANQDVFGSGVLISYYIQAVLLLLLAGAVLVSAAWQLFRYGSSPPVMGKPTQSVLKKFLATECYFGVTAAIASFFMFPDEVDPLNGYALVAVSLMGCIAPAFTLLLLHSHGIKSWSSTVLCLASWLLNTVVFYMLFGNLRNSLNTIERVDQILRGLFQTEYCGNSSAMVLCQEWTGSNPMQYLSHFYNENSVITIHNVPVFWAYVTIVLLILVTMQVLGQRRRPSPMSFTPTKEARPTQKRTVIGRITHLSPRFGKFLLLLTATILFCLALGCVYVMVSTYAKMDVIDMHEWSFGQVVAVLIWAPTLLEAVESYYGKKHTSGTRTSLNQPMPIPPPQISESRRLLAHP